MTVLEESLAAPVEEASDRFNTEKVVTIAAAHGAHDTYFSFLPPILPLLIEKLAISKTEAGILTIFWQGPALFQPLFGHLADRVSLRYLIILAPAISAAMVTLVGIAPSYSVVALLLLVAGFSTAGFHAVAPAMVGAYSGKKLGRGMSIFMVGGELGFAIGPLVVVAAIGWLTLRGLPWLMSFGLLVSLILFLRIRESPRMAGGTGQALPLKVALKRMVPFMLPLFWMNFFMAFLNAHISTYLPTYLTGEGVGLFLAGASFSLVEFAATGGTLFSGWLSDRFGRRVVLLFTGVATPLFALAFLSVRGWPMIPLLILIGFSAYCIIPTLMALVQENFSENRALANGVYLAISFVVRSIVVVIVGAIADRYGFRWGFTASAFLYFLALPFIFMLPKR